jgi:hypothetical protein
VFVARCYFKLSRTAPLRPRLRQVLVHKGVVRCAWDRTYPTIPYQKGSWAVKAAVSRIWRG